MFYYARVDQSGQVLDIGVLANPSEFNEELKQLKQSDYELLRLGGFTASFDVDGNLNFVEIPPPSIEQINAEKLAEVRNQRNAILASCDFRALPDYPNADKQEWLDYRQKLRDFMGSYDPSLPPVWPETPIKKEASKPEAKPKKKEVLAPVEEVAAQQEQVEKPAPVEE